VADERWETPWSPFHDWGLDYLWNWDDIGLSVTCLSPFYGCKNYSPWSAYRDFLKSSVATNLLDFTPTDGEVGSFWSLLLKWRREITLRLVTVDAWLTRSKIFGKFMG